ncbi:MAG: Crp/Fnr family transcriptional regulator, partial [Gemmatimonadaceae bacterium]
MAAPGLTFVGPIPTNDQLFPTLTAAQVSRLAAIGRKREMARGDVLLHPGDTNTSIFVVTAGSVDVIRATDGGEERIVTHKAGAFSGEVNALTGRPAFVTIRCAEPGEVIEVDRDHLREIVQTDAELSEIMMRAFVLRRVEMINRGIGDVVLVGSNHSAGTLRIKEFLSRNGHPYVYLDLDRDEGVQALLDRFHVDVAEIPVTICRGTFVLRNPTNQELADCLGMN